MTKFKIGDKVQVINKVDPYFKKKGVIDHESYSYDWRVRFPDGHWSYFYESELKLITPKKKAKKECEHLTYDYSDTKGRTRTCKDCVYIDYSIKEPSCVHDWRQVIYASWNESKFYCTKCLEIVSK